MVNITASLQAMQVAEFVNVHFKRESCKQTSFRAIHGSNFVL